MIEYKIKDGRLILNKQGSQFAVDKEQARQLQEILSQYLAADEHKYDDYPSYDIHRCLQGINSNLWVFK